MKKLVLKVEMMKRKVKNIDATIAISFILKMMGSPCEGILFFLIRLRFLKLCLWNKFRVVFACHFFVVRNACLLLMMLHKNMNSLTSYCSVFHVVRFV